MQPSHSKAGRIRSRGAASKALGGKDTQIEPVVAGGAEGILSVPVSREGVGGRPAPAPRALPILAARAVRSRFRAGPKASVERVVPGLGERHAAQIAVIDEFAQIGA